MDIQKIIQELTNKKIIETNVKDYQQLNGGTSSYLYLIRNSDGSGYVVKVNGPQVMESEAYFLDFYKEENILPNLLYVDGAYNYIVYTFMSGSTSYIANYSKENGVGHGHTP